MSDGPWLRRRDWASRQLVAGDGVVAVVLFASVYLIGFVLGVGFIALAIRWVFDSWVSALLVFSVVIAVVIRKLVERVLYSGTVFSRVVCYRCRLETLPGVIGGWFKAEVEAKLPQAPAIATVSLSCVEEDDDSPTVHWRGAYRLIGKDLREGPPGHYRIPVRFKVPGHLLGSGDRTWNLVVETPPGEDRQCRFEVPVYVTDRAPAAEQQDEPGYDESMAGSEPLTLKLEPSPARS